MIRIAIVEDDKRELEQLKSCIEQYGKEKDESFSVAEFKDGLSFLDNYKPVYDIVFMDINMPYESGLGVAKRLRMIDTDVCLVFVTQMAQYAINAFDVNARDYILKPVIYSAFEFRFERVINTVRANALAHKFIFVKTRGGAVRLDVDSILYVEVVRHTIIYHTVNGDIETWESLKNVESALGGLGEGGNTQFARCNNCFLVNIRYVDKIENDTAYVGKEELKISRSRRKEFVNAFTLYFAHGGK